MQQPSISKNCPVCRQSFDKEDEKKDKKNQNPKAKKTSDEDRRMERLMKHMNTLQELKLRFLESIYSEAMKELDVIEPLKVVVIKQIIQRNFKNLITPGHSNLEMHKNAQGGIAVLDDELIFLGEYMVNRVKVVLQDLLFSCQTKNNQRNNTICCTGHGFSIPDISGTSNSSNQLLKSLKMEYLVQLIRVYRSKKHLDFTSTRSYLEMLTNRKTGGSN